jgi:hypothetical protein
MPGEKALSPASDDEPVADLAPARSPLLVWGLGVVVSVLVIGPGLAPGSLLNLDLILVPDPPLPPGFWGLGPELPRRVPMWVFVTWLSPLLGGDAVGKLLMLVGLTLAFVGMFRLAASMLERSGTASVTLLAIGAAGIYAFSPFLVTRVAVGHFMVLWTMAVLPWAAPSLLEAHRSGRRTFLWSLAFAVAGVYGAAICGALLIAGQVVARGRRAGVVAATFLAGQLVWLVPMTIVLLTARSGVRSNASAFPASLHGIGAFGQLVAGLGFWSPVFQVGGSSPYLAVTGIVLAALAVFGVPELPRGWRGPLTFLAGISFVVSASSALAGTSSVALWVTSTPLGAPFRETQRMLTLFVFWVAPTAALGAVRLARTFRGGLAAVCLTLPVVLAVILLGPGLWGAGGQLKPITFGNDWKAARSAVVAEPGTLIALPWYEYYSSEMTDHRTVLNVMPYYFGGDVITASDPNITAEAHQEGLDPREAPVSALVERLRAGEHVSSDLADLGVRWIALQHAIDWQTYRGLDDDPGLETVVSGESMTLLEVTDWHGPAWSADGQTVTERGPVAPLRTLSSDGPATRAAPFQSGWLQGSRAVTEASGGLMTLPGGSTSVWFWPTTTALVTYALVATATVAVFATYRRDRRTQRRRNEAEAE